MSAIVPHLTSDPGRVWRIGFELDMWAWTPWRYATDDGLFNGRWDDQLGQFRTLYTSDNLRGCFLELCAKLQPSKPLQTVLDEIEDDDGSIALHPEGASGEVGYSWLNGRVYGDAEQSGRYWFITHSDSLAALKAEYPFGRHGIALVDVDSALLKNADDRNLTRSIANWVYDRRNEDRDELVDGIEFRSRHGDEIRMWAVFERSDDEQGSSHITPLSEPQRVTPETDELLEAFERLGLHWVEDGWGATPATEVGLMKLDDETPAKELRAWAKGMLPIEAGTYRRTADSTRQVVRVRGQAPTYSARNCPVSVDRSAMRSAGVPSKTTRPPSCPAPGPMSMIQSACAITA